MVSSYAINCKTCYIYIRGEFTRASASLTGRLDEAYAAGYVGKNILGTGVDVDIYLHRGAGSYECGEETALIESLEGKRGQPRAQAAVPGGLRPLQLPHGGEQRRDPRLRAAHPGAGRGVVRRPGLREERRAQALLRQRPREAPRRYEAPMGQDHAAAAHLRRGLRRRAARRAQAPLRGPRRVLDPGPHRRRDRRDHGLRPRGQGRVDARAPRAPSSWTTRPAWCGWPSGSPTSTGTSRAASARPAARARAGCCGCCDKIEEGQGTERDLEVLWNVCDSIAGKTVCAVRRRGGHAAQSTLKKFRDEYEYHVREKRCWRKVAADVRGGQGHGSRRPRRAGAARDSLSPVQELAITVVKVLVLFNALLALFSLMTWGGAAPAGLHAVPAGPEPHGAHRASSSPWPTASSSSSRRS